MFCSTVFREKKKIIKREIWGSVLAGEEAGKAGGSSPSCSASAHPLSKESFTAMFSRTR